MRSNRIRGAYACIVAMKNSSQLALDVKECDHSTFSLGDIFYLALVFILPVLHQDAA